MKVQQRWRPWSDPVPRKRRPYLPRRHPNLLRPPKPRRRRHNASHTTPGRHDAAAAAAAAAPDAAPDAAPPAAIVPLLVEPIPRRRRPPAKARQPHPRREQHALSVHVGVVVDAGCVLVRRRGRWRTGQQAPEGHGQLRPLARELRDGDGLQHGRPAECRTSHAEEVLRKKRKIWLEKCIYLYDLEWIRVVGNICSRKLFSSIGSHWMRRFR